MNKLEYIITKSQPVYRIKIPIDFLKPYEEDERTESSYEMLQIIEKEDLLSVFINGILQSYILEHYDIELKDGHFVYVFPKDELRVNDTITFMY